MCKIRSSRQNPASSSQRRHLFHAICWAHPPFIFRKQSSHYPGEMDSTKLVAFREHAKQDRSTILHLYSTICCWIRLRWSISSFFRSRHRWLWIGGNRNQHWRNLYIITTYILLPIYNSYSYQTTTGQEFSNARCKLIALSVIVACTHTSLPYKTVAGYTCRSYRTLLPIRNRHTIFRR